ncbi:MAG: mannitol dehydrogenase family protein [Octadecabacter sp.]
MTAERLSNLNVIAGPARLPGYTPADHGAGIVHLGVGAFHRAHQAVITDDALATDGGDWRIIGVSLRSEAMAQALNPQNGLYTLIECGDAGTSARVIGAISRVISVDPKATLAALCDPAIRIVTITVTEKGYAIDRSTRAPDPRDPVVVADLANSHAPCGILGLLCEALEQRRAADVDPFTVLSCDNLPENGALLRDGLVGFARLSGNNDLADWIIDNVAFPSSMVDRITPAATSATYEEAVNQTGCEDRAAVETEPFIQWIIEDDFPTGRPQWEAGGALFVDEVAPYERMKLTMLNGSHSMLACAGFLAGRKFVRDVMSDPDLCVLVKGHLAASADLLPTLTGVDFSDYADALAERFRNPAIDHQTYQIATDGTKKLPQRIFQPAKQALEDGKDLRPFAFATAMWMRYCMGVLDDGTRFDLKDPRSAELTAALSKAPQTASDISKVLHELPNLIPMELSASNEWRRHIEDVLSAVLEHGCLAAIQHEARQEGAQSIEPQHETRRIPEEAPE